MTWRVPKGGKYWEEHKGEPNRRAFRKLVESGHAHGTLALEGDRPVGWCSLGPREHFPRLDHSRTYDVPGPEGRWLISCFFIPPPHRGKGIGKGLLKAAISEARRRHVPCLDAFPAKLPASGKLPGAFVWTGVPSMFEKAGFDEITPKGQARPVYRLALS
ncbi:MAG: GNAT family N-acetyltransferase, partial [Gammaproteobacteria bacterium]|jgi:GNAT superfamily N-acetyltransferase